jgi:hypothetical protein
MLCFTFQRLRSFYLLLAFKVMQSLRADKPFIHDIYCAGLLLLRAYAIASHKRLVLAVLGALGGCAVVMQLVCSHVCVHCEYA